MSDNITHLSDFTHMSTNIGQFSGNTNISSDFQTSQFQTSQCTEMSVIFVFFTTSEYTCIKISVAPLAGTGLYKTTPPLKSLKCRQLVLACIRVHLH